MMRESPVLLPIGRGGRFSGLLFSSYFDCNYAQTKQSHYKKYIYNLKKPIIDWSVDNRLECRRLGYQTMLELTLEYLKS